MMGQDSEKNVWLLCLVIGKSPCSDLSVLGVFSTRKKAEDTLERLPSSQTYILYRAPIDEFFGYFRKDGVLKDGMGQLQHYHFEPED